MIFENTWVMEFWERDIFRDAANPLHTALILRRVLCTI